MKIDRNNYEAFFIDYLEGNLDNKMIDDFIEFLQQNPDLKKELSLFENISIEQEEITFNKKDLLLKEKYDEEKEFNEAAVAELEGDISSSEKIEFENYLSNHPEKQKEVELFKLTKLHPDELITFNKKNKIFHRSAGKTVLLWSVRVAAVMIIVLSVYIFMDTSSDKIFDQKQAAAVIEQEPQKKENYPKVMDEPEKKEKKVVEPVLKKETDKPVLKKQKPKTEPTKSLRENSKGRLENNDLTYIRTNEEIPAKLNSLNPTIFAGIPKAELVPVKFTVPEINESITEEKFFVDMVKEKTGLENLSINKITKAGLSLVSNVSKDKFNYDTNTDGEVTEVKYDSRFLAFSFPTKKEKDR